MMVSEKEAVSIRRFVVHQLRDEPDLSKLTLAILKKRYLAEQRCESLSPTARTYMKQVVEEELIKMQENDEDGSELETKKPQTKRKREEKEEEVESEGEKESIRKKVRSNSSSSLSSSSSELEEKEEDKTGSEGEEHNNSQRNDAKQEVKKINGNGKKRVNEDSADEKTSESEKEGNESSCDDSPKQIVKKNEKTESSHTNEEKKIPGSENESDEDNKSERSDKTNNSDSSDSEKEEKVLVKKKNNNSDSDSSLEDSGPENASDKKTKKKKKAVKRDESTKRPKDEHKAIVRLKRYISLCGVRRNYKKLLDDCRSIKSKVAVLKKELEDLGVRGKPSVEKCKKVRMKREEAQELAELDASNIITTQGRPKRRGASAWQERQEQQDPPSSAYQRTLNSGSDSDDENSAHRGCRKMSEWTNLRGIISDDDDSD